jgi:hypothetical protein
LEQPGGQQDPAHGVFGSAGCDGRSDDRKRPGKEDTSDEIEPRCSVGDAQNEMRHGQRKRQRR